MNERSKNKATALPSGPSVSPAGEGPEVEGPSSLQSGNPAAGLNDRWLVPGVCLFLAAVIWVVFGQTLHHDFVNYDDDSYVYQNPEVAPGLTLEGIVWAFTRVHCSNWHPLTWISHMLDCQFYGLSPGGHHLTNILLHTATAILLFLVLRRMTGFLWRSAFVAAVFAIHPLRVESVAWVAERKDVLSGLFFMLTLWAYTRYVEEFKVQSSKFKVFFGLSLLVFALGLLCKPMLVTLPLILLLLDYWPLNRLRANAATEPIFRLAGQLVPKRLVFEKLPFFGLAVASCVATIFAQTGAIQSFEQISLPLRVGNASISCVAYLGQMFWPSGLAVFYPFTAAGIKVSEVVLSLVLLAGISTGVFVVRRRPYLLTGWLWYLIMLLPVIGIVQVGAQARADRYTYLPQIGLYVLLAWAAADLCAGWRYRRVVLGGSATLILAALLFCARTQTSYWQNSETLWTHTLACTSDNALAHNNLGNALLKMGGVDEAIAHFQKALRIIPDNAEAQNNLGNVLLQKGKVDEAIVHCQRALQIKPDFAEAHNNLGNALLQKGKVDEAMAQYQAALEIKPDSVQPHNNLGGALLQKGEVDEAIAQYQAALEIKPDFAEAQNNLDIALRQKDREDEAIARYQKALQIKPDAPDVLNNLAWLLATCPDARIRDGAQAVRHAERACELTHYSVTPIVGTLAAADAEAGRFDDAMAAAQKAIALAGKNHEPELLQKNRELLELYRAHQAYHEIWAREDQLSPGSGATGARR